MNHYSSLGIPPDADDEITRHALRELVRRYHSDAAGSSAEKLSRIVEAYEVLREVRRAASLRAAQRRESWPRVKPLRAERL